MEASQSPFIEGALLWGLCKVPRGFVHTYNTHMHISVFFSYRYRGYFTIEALWNPSIEGASLWGLCKASIKRRLCKTPIERGFAMAASQSPSIQGAFYTHTYTHMHISVFSYRYGGTSLWRLCEAPFYKGLCKTLYRRGFAMGALWRPSVQKALRALWSPLR